MTQKLGPVAECLNTSAGNIFCLTNIVRKIFGDEGWNIRPAPKWSAGGFSEIG
jgi:hypothetical protein